MAGAVDFVLDDDGSVVPYVAGASLLDLVERFETGRRYEPAGGYAGLAAGHIDDPLAYFLGAATPEGSRVWLLGCDCGEAGCWPLEATVSVSHERVVWSDFAQPFRPAWSYDGFGPFVFPRTDHDAAVRDLTERLG